MPASTQISLDVDTIDEALRLAAVADRAGIDWLEAGTGLIASEGTACVRALREKFPHRLVVADTKVVDGGAYYVELMAQAGAHFVVHMSGSHENVLRQAALAGRKLGVKIMADIMLESDKAAAAARAEKLGVAWIVHHLGYDERAQDTWKKPLDGLKEVRAAVKIPIQVVGGLTIEEAHEAIHLGADSIVIGGPIIPGDWGPDLEATLRRVVEGRPH
jgi:3-hexulose-6-phosphate synthase/6-phospho-3-hexuloisomerase